MVGNVKKMFWVHFCNCINYLDSVFLQKRYLTSPLGHNHKEFPRIEINPRKWSAVQTEDSHKLGRGEMGSIMVAIIKFHWDIANSQHANIINESGWECQL